ncbi:MAG: hypothetical protein ACLRPR_08985 [Eisenbergiella sp.]
MRKSQIVLLIMLAAGAMLTGVGAGAAFEEYSSMKYEGTVLIGEEYWKTDTIICERETGETVPLWINTDRYPESWNVELIEDESVAREEVAVDITYNEGVYVPHAALEPVMELIGEEPEDIWETEYVEKTETGTQQPEKTADRLEIWISYKGSEFNILMENKDRMLTMLKEGKIASFEMATVKDVKIRVNPDVMEYVESE